MKKRLLWVVFHLVAWGSLPSAQTQAGPWIGKTPYPPQTAYSPLHYWLPGYYYFKMHHRPFYYEQYTPVEQPGVIVEPTTPSKEKEILPPPQTEPKKEVLPLPIPEPKKEVLPIPEPKKKVFPSPMPLPIPGPQMKVLPSPIPELKKEVPPPPNNGLQPISATTVPAQPMRFPFLGNWVPRPQY